MSIFRRKVFEWSEKIDITASERRSMLLLIAIYSLIKLSFLGYNTINEPDSLPEQLLAIQMQQLTPQNSPKDVRPIMVADSSEFEQFARVEVNITSAEHPIKNKSEPTPTAVDINTATEQQLITLPGIGPSYAKRIIAWRDQHGAFESKEELLQIKGIGSTRLAKLKDHITLGRSGKNQ